MLALSASAAAAPVKGARFERLEAGRLVPATLRDDTRHVAYYYGTSWCGPCRLFVPRLIAATPTLAARHVEGVFVSDDGGCPAATDYARRSRMPWLLLPCEDRARRTRLRALGGTALPGLVLPATAAACRRVGGPMATANLSPRSARS